MFLHSFITSAIAEKVSALTTQNYNATRAKSARKGAFRKVLDRVTNKKQIPVFKNEGEEREFWATHDATEFLDWSKAKRAIFPNLKPSTKSISLRLPESLLVGLMMLANKRNVPYQSLLKVFLAEKVDQELRPRRVKTA